MVGPVAAPRRLAIIATHPIQHFCPQYASLALRDDVQLLVLFHSTQGLTPYHDAEFERVISWKGDLADGFDWVHVPNARTLRTELDRFRPDWVWIYGYRSKVSRYALRWLLRNPHVSCAYVSDSELRHHESNIRRVLKRLILRVIFKRVDAFLTVGNANEEFYRSAGAGNERLVRMHYPIDILEMRRSQGSDGSSNIRESLGIRPNAVVILNVGKLISRKRQANLIECAVRFSPDEAHFILVGSGGDESALREQAGQAANVSLVGFVPPTELPPYYELADIYVHVSSHDPHPLSVSEAINFGCAIVVSRTIGSWGNDDDVRPYQNGFVVDVDDGDALFSAVKLLLESNSLRDRMGRLSLASSRIYQARAHGGFVEELWSRSRTPVRRVTHTRAGLANGDSLHGER